jgi:hypothetical protein
MRKYLVIVVLSLTGLGAFSQDTSQVREKEAHYNYMTASFLVYTNTAGSFNQKTFFSIEAGRTYGIFDIGFAVGRLNMVASGHGIDSNWFAEVRPTINVFSKGRFSESLTLGAGHVFNARLNFITEITNCINFSPNNNITISVCQGNYFLDGSESTSRAQFMGLSLTYNLIKKNSEVDKKKGKSLIN